MLIWALPPVAKHWGLITAIDTQQRNNAAPGLSAPTQLGDMAPFIFPLYLQMVSGCLVDADVVYFV